MTLRQANGRASSTVPSWPTGASSSSSPTAITNVSCVEIRSDTEPASKPSKKHSLIDQKRRQWAEERAEQEEWYPFGRPGAGAPLKSPAERLSQQRLRRQNITAPSGSCCSDGGASNGSITEFGGVNSSVPVYCQINSENHCANGRYQQQPHPPPENLPDPSTVPNGYVFGPTNGFYAPYPGVVMPAPAAALDPTCQTCPPVGAMVGLPNQPVPGAHYVHPYAPMTLPGVVNGSASESATDVGKHFAVVGPYYPHQPFYGYPQGIGTVANMHDQAQGYHVLPAFAPAPAFPTDSSVVSGGRNSLTASTASPPYNAQAPPAPHSQPALQRPGAPNQANGSYTEQWANQLQIWQDNEPHSPDHQRPNNLPIQRPLIPASEPGVAMPSPQPLHLQSPVPTHPVFAAAHTSTPVAYGQHPMAMAWVTPIQAKPDHPSRLAMVPHRTAIVSPLHSKAPSLSGNETLDGSTNLQFMSASFSGSMPPGGDDIHRRRANITAPKEEHDLEEKQIKIMEHKLALEEQLVEKRRKQLIEEQRERREFERAERERRLIEEQKTLENEEERSRWRKMADKEEKREELIMGPLHRAQDEARKFRHAKILRHASCGRQSESEGYESMSPPVPTTTRSNHDQPNGATRNQEEDDASPASSTTGPMALNGARSQSLPPPAANSQMAESPADERPIRPLTQDPLKMWEELGYEAIGVDITKSEPRRNAPVRQSLRKSRSTEATRLEAARRAESLERKRAAPVTNGNGSHETPKSVTANGRIAKKIEKEQMDEEILPRHNGHFNDRLKSAGLISNATFIMDSRENGKHDSKTDSKLKEADRKEKILAKKSTNDATESATNGISFESGKPMESNGKLKLLERRSTAEKPMLPPVNDNPWGNTLGGLNPLLQPIVTRRRKPRPSLPTPTDEQDRKLQLDVPSSTMTKALNGDIRLKSGSSSDLSVGISENDTNNNESKKATVPPKSENGISPSTTQTGKPAFMRAPSLDRFNARSPLYGSISAKMKRPTESQNKLMEQLSLLRQQLKKKQKEVEDNLTSPPRSTPIRD